PDWSGLLFALSLITGTFLLAWLVIYLAWAIHPVAGIAVEVIFLFYCISVRSLEKAALNVQAALREEGLPQGRAAVAMIVGRETDGLDEAEVARAAVETVAENLVDGVLSPLFYALLGGVPLALSYKMANTLDSMVGYKNEKYRYFGKAAARIDDAANYIPARLSVLFIAAAARMTGQQGKSALRIGFRDGRRHTSPNAGFPEAAFAGALGVRLGGPGTYHGRRIEKPSLGEEYGPVRTHDIRRACRLMVVTSLLGMAVVQLLYLIAGP
ncbi:MAG: cobalamin biosynthesis protein CobD, partial [Desulfobacterales bacterium]|nr:cobalamin biosynthesis protein CobD [Desulfobacterales bacterium]